MAEEAQEMTHTTKQLINAHYVAYEAYAEFAAAAMAALMQKRTLAQLQLEETKTGVCLLAHEYALEMVSHRDHEQEHLLQEVD